MNTQSRKIFEQAMTGFLPPGMTAKELAAIKEEMDYHPLWRRGGLGLLQNIPALKTSEKQPEQSRLCCD